MGNRESGNRRDDNGPNKDSSGTEKEPVVVEEIHQISDHSESESVRPVNDDEMEPGITPKDAPNVHVETVDSIIESMSSVSSLDLTDKDYGQCCFNVVLKSSRNNDTKQRPLVVPGYPTTGMALKKHIQMKFNIPLCVQTLSFSSQVVQDKASLRSLYLQHGDTIQVDYTMDADIEYFSDLINTLTCIRTLLPVIVAEITAGAPITYTMHQTLQTDCASFTSDCVPLRYFTVFPTGTPNANQLYFLDLGGLKVLVDIYRLVHELPWHKLPGELQDLEYACLQIIWNFSATLGIRQMIVQDGVLELVFKTFNRTKIIPYNQIRISEPLLDMYLSIQHSISMLAEAVYASLVVIGNFAEMPQCRIPIASSTEVIDTLLAAMLSPTYTYTCARSGMCAMLCLSFSPNTHQYISHEDTLIKVLEVCDRTHNVPDGTSEKERATNQTLVQFYALLFFCNLFHHWHSQPRVLSESLLSRITDFMTTYINNTSHDVVLKRMQEKRYYWSTFIPFLSLCYCPAAIHGDDIHHPIPKCVLEQTVKAGVLSMKCMCLSENALDVIDYEGLQDFISCMSWYTASSDSVEIKHLLAEVTHIAHQNLRFQPPSLSNIVRAMLASYYCGLDKALECDAYSLVHYVVRNSTY